MFTDPNYFFNETLVPTAIFSIENGTSVNSTIYTISEVYGMDLLISLMIVSVVFQVITFAYMFLRGNLRRKQK
jgi:hypothetical protein